MVGLWTLCQGEQNTNDNEGTAQQALLVSSLVGPVGSDCEVNPWNPSWPTIGLTCAASFKIAGAGSVSVH
eukprot:4980493-Amphidinium_carterae.1